MKSIEFYKTPYGKIMCQPVGEAAREVTESDREMIQEMLQLISERYPKAFEALSCLYSKSQRNRAYFEYQIVSRFIRCNFGSNDTLSHDIDEGMMHLERVSCPLRKCCKNENIVCNPKVHSPFFPKETEVAKIFAQGYVASEVAQKLGKSLHTVTSQLRNMTKRLKLRSSREIIKIVHKLNL